MYQVKQRQRSAAFEDIQPVSKCIEFIKEFVRDAIRFSYLERLFFIHIYIFFNRLLECYVAYFTEKSAKERALLGIVKEKEHSPTFIVNELFLLAREFRVLRRFHNHNTTVFCVL